MRAPLLRLPALRRDLGQQVLAADALVLGVVALADADVLHRDADRVEFLPVDGERAPALVDLRDGAADVVGERGSGNEGYGHGQDRGQGIGAVLLGGWRRAPTTG